MSSSTRPVKSLVPGKDGRSVVILDQTLLPHRVRTLRLRTVGEFAEAIRSMQVRGSNLIGVTAAFGLAAGLRKDPSDRSLGAVFEELVHTRPTAVNLRWALERIRALVAPLPPAERARAAWTEAVAMVAEDVETNRSIGRHGLELLRRLAARKKPGEPLQVMTHCNAGRIATLDWGTATAPIYLAQESGIPIHVWVSETRPRNQGAALTAWELGGRGIPHTLIPDNSAGHLMQRGLVDAVLVGADRVTARGDVANKIGTYLKALAAREHGVPFYVAFVGGSVDWTLQDGVREIPIEQRNGREITHVRGRTDSGRTVEVRLTPEGVPTRNDGFDVTPARFITALITEKGNCPASEAGLRRLYRRRAG